MALNDNIEALKKLAAEVAQAATRFTKTAATVTKANFSMLSEQEKLKKAYQELGKLYYRDYITGEEPDDAEYIPLCDAITETTKLIDELKSKVEDAKKPKEAETECCCGETDEENACCCEEKEAEEQESCCCEDKGACCCDVDKAAEDLNKELDELHENLKDLGKTVEEKAEAIFEVVDDAKPEEKTEEKPEK